MWHMISVTDHQMIYHVSLLIWLLQLLKKLSMFEYKKDHNLVVRIAINDRLNSKYLWCSVDDVVEPGLRVILKKRDPWKEERE